MAGPTPKSAVSEDEDAEITEAFPPDSVPESAPETAAYEPRHVKQPKGTSFGNQDPGE